MSDEFGPCPLCGGPLTHDDMTETLLCVCCGEFQPIGRMWHPVQVIASTREAEEQRRLMSESEQEALIRWRKGWGAW